MLESYIHGRPQEFFQGGGGKKIPPPLHTRKLTTKFLFDFISNFFSFLNQSAEVVFKLRQLNQLKPKF